MTTIYVLTSGSYSDYRVDGVYSTREMAQAVIDRGWGGEIEEYELDELADFLEKGLNCYWVEMQRNGDSEVRASYPNNDGYEELSLWAYEPREYRLCMRIVAKDEQHAVKIANERRMQLIASGEWK